MGTQISIPTNLGSTVSLVTKNRSEDKRTAATIGITR